MTSKQHERGKARRKELFQGKSRKRIPNKGWKSWRQFVVAEGRLLAVRTPRGGVKCDRLLDSTMLGVHSNNLAHHELDIGLGILLQPWIIDL